jgi:uncharacterized repeat protein (TIGR02543 family)
MTHQKSMITVCILALVCVGFSCELPSVGDPGGDESVTYTVTFESNGGDPVAQQVVASGGKVIKPTDPTKESFTFQGWFKEVALMTLWDFDADTVTQDLTLYAGWESTARYVHFNANGGTGSFDSLQCTPGETQSLPFMDTQITREGYKFISWNTVADRIGGTEYMQQANVTLTDSNLTLYAQWVKLYDIGDTGPGGGLVFYSKNLDSIWRYPDWVYMEAAPVSTEVERTWGGNAEPNTSEDIGKGLENTAIITASFSGDYAAHYCQNLEYGGYDDWYLPSRPELAYICDRLYRNNVGDFESQGVYWSSSEKTQDTQEYAYVIIFDLELYNPLVMVNPQKKSTAFNVRAARRF